MTITLLFCHVYYKHPLSQFYHTLCKCIFTAITVISLTVLQACEENICKNGGNCSKHVDDYRCDCRPGFTGILCEELEGTYL